MPKGKVKKSVKRNAYKQLKREEINLLEQQLATEKKEGSSNSSIDNLCQNKSTNTTDFDCASGLGQCNKGASVPSKDVGRPSVSTAEKKVLGRNCCKRFGDIQRVFTHFDDIIIVAKTEAQRDALLKQALTGAQTDESDEEECTTEVPDQPLNLTEKVRLWAVKHKVKDDASSSLLNILKRYYPQYF